MTKIDMSNYHLEQAIMAALVADGEKVTSAELVRAEGNKDEQLVVLKLAYEDGLVMDVSFYVYFDGSWFSPWDWHGCQAQRKDEVEDFDWQLGVTGRKAVILGGAPRMLFGE
jgi:hypothetical protein